MCIAGFETGTSEAVTTNKDSAEIGMDDISDNEPEQQSPKPAAESPKEIGGRAGPDPTRYGDWEKNGRCIDF